MRENWSERQLLQILQRFKKRENVLWKDVWIINFKIEFSRIDRNKSPLSGQENGRINDHISDLEQAVLSCLREKPEMTNAELIVKTGKSQRTITRVLSALKGKGLISRIGSNKTGYWNVR